MNLGNIDFREFDRKWIVFDRKKDIQKITKKLKLKKHEGIFLGYIYISHEDGIQIKIVGNVVKEEEQYHLDEEFIHKETSIPFSKDCNYHILPVEKHITKRIKYTDEIENQFADLYDKNSILESRKIENIDTFRHDTYIDDVELLLEAKNKQEYLWARIQDCSKEKLIFVCSLLDSSKRNKNYKEGTLVLAKLVPNKKSIDFVIDGIVDRVKK